MAARSQPSPTPADRVDDTPPPDLTERAYRWAVLSLTLLMFSACLGWAASMPGFHGPDEPRHVNSVLRVAAGDGWPAPYEAPIADVTWRALMEAGSPTYGARLPLGSPRAAPQPDEARSTFEDPGPWTDHGVDQMVQHPPTYYVLTAGVLNAVGGTSLTWDTAVLVMRTVSAIAAAAALPLLAGVARRVTGSRRAGLVGAASVLGIPFFVTLGGYASNDALLLPTVSGALYAGVRAVDSARPARWLVASGVFLGVALLTKGLALMAIPAVFLLSAMAVRRGVEQRGLVRSLALLFAAQAVAFVIGGWWWARNLLELGILQPSRFGSFDPTRSYDVSPFTFASIFVNRFAGLFWGRSVDPRIAYPMELVAVATLLLVGVLATALLVTRRRVLLAVLFIVPAFITVTIAYNAWSIYNDFNVPNRGVQGRYIFSGIAAICASVAVVFHRFLGRSTRARHHARLVVGAFITVSVAGWVWVMARIWYATGPALEPPDPDPLALGPAALGMLGLLTLGTALATVLTVGRPSDGPPPDQSVPDSARAVV